MDAKEIGSAIKARRKALGVTASATAGAAGISRVTLYRIEKGEGSPSLPHLLAVLKSLNLELNIASDGLGMVESSSQSIKDMIPVHIELDHYPGLKAIAWHVTGRNYLKPVEAWDLYERNNRHLDFDSLSASEKSLLKSLERAFA